MTLPRLSRALTTIALTACLLAAGLVVAQTNAHARTRACPDPPSKAGLKGGYFKALRVTNVTCATGKKLVYAYYACRMRKGGRKASCSGRTINNLRCSERRNPDLETELVFSATVTCKKGTKKVVHTYDQNLR